MMTNEYAVKRLVDSVGYVGEEDWNEIFGSEE